jgi:putative sugar O-methyltransferase
LPIIKKIYEDQLKVTSDHINNFLKNLSVIYQNDEKVNYLLNKYKFKNTTEFGCVQKFSKNEQEFSTFYLEIADRVDILSKKFNFNKIQTYFEIGGGFGANIHFLLTNFKNIKKIIYLDAVPSIYVGTEYLRHFYGESVKDYLSTSTSKELSFENNEKLEIICIPPWEIEKIKVEINHFHNAASFVEMPEEVIKNYVKYLKKNNTNQISLISYDGYDLKTTFNPELLNNFFDNKLDFEWHPAVIKDYNNKSLYLTSKV